MVWSITSSGSKEDCEKIQPEMRQVQTTSSSRLMFAVASFLALAMGVFIFVALLQMNPHSSIKMTTTTSSPDAGFVPPEVFICPDKPYSPVKAALEIREPERLKRQSELQQQIKRIYRPLAHPPRHGWNFEQEPALYHDSGARCSWVDLAQKRLAGLDEQSYDFQILELINCTSPSDCRAICMRMHKPNDPNVCNYVIMNRVRQIALFYNIDPTVNWNLLNDPTSDSFFWKCSSINCDWNWRRGQKLNSVKLGDRDGQLVLKTQCRDFAACQRICETHPTCNYIIMPKNRAVGGPSYLYSVPNDSFKQANYALEEDRHSFELACKPPTPPGSVPQVAHAPPQPAASDVQTAESKLPLPQGQQIPPQAQNIAASSPIGSGGNFQVGAAPGTNGQLPPPTSGQGELLAANPNPNPPPSIPRDHLPPAPSVPKVDDIETLVDAKSLPQQRSRRFACLDPKNCPAGAMLMDECSVSEHPMECQDVAHQVLSLGSQHRCLHVSLINEFFQYKFDKLNFKAVLLSLKGTQPQAGFWVSLVPNPNRGDMRKDVFVETQLPSAYEIEQEANGYKIVISTETQTTEEGGQKILFGLNMKSVMAGIQQHQGDFCAAITLYYAGIVAAISFMLLAAYSLFNFLKY